MDWPVTVAVGSIVLLLVVGTTLIGALPAMVVMSYWKFMSKGTSKKTAPTQTGGKPGNPKKASAAETSQKKKEGPVASGGTS
jgi:hypothetical protein